MRLPIRVGVAVILVTTVCMALPAVSGASTLSKTERAVLRLVNSTRALHGLRPVQLSTALCKAARSHSVDMVRKDYFAHLSLGGATPSIRASSSGYRPAVSVGECIGWGKGSLGTATAMMRAWLRSSGHRAIILGSKWQHVGIGCAYGSFQGYAGARVFTLDLGSRR